LKKLLFNTKYMKLNLLFIFTILSGLFFSCKSNSGDEANADEKKIDKYAYEDTSLPFDERLKDFIVRKIGTAPNEEYTLKIYEEHLNDDDKKDIIITVNRLQYAIQNAKENNRLNRAEEVGFFGNYNYIIYYSSITNQFIDPIIMGSSPLQELDIAFDNISSTKHKDLIADYAIRNSQFRKYFLFIDDRPVYAFHWKKYDGWGTDNLEAYCFELDKGTYNATKDIVIRKATMKNIGPDEDYTKIKPEITCTGELIKRFFYNDKDGKYYTPN